MRHTLIALLLTALSATAIAQDTSWDGGGDGHSWNDAANWNPDGVPAANAYVEFNIGGSLTVDGSAPNAPSRVDIVNGSTVTFDMNLAVGDGSFDSHGFKVQANAVANFGTPGGGQVFTFNVPDNRSAILHNASGAPAVINVPAGVTVNIVGAQRGIDVSGGPNEFNNSGTVNISGIADEGIRARSGAVNNLADGVMTITLPSSAGVGNNNILLEATDPAVFGTLVNAGTITMPEGNTARRVIVGGGTMTNAPGGIIDLYAGRLRNDVDGTFTNNGLLISTFGCPDACAAGVFGTADAGDSINNAFYDYGDTDGSLTFGGGTGIADNGVNVDSPEQMTVDAAESCQVADLGIRAAYEWFDNAANDTKVGSNNAAGLLTFLNDAFDTFGTQTIYTVYGDTAVFTVNNVEGDCTPEPPPEPTYPLGGTVSGLVGSVTLQNNGADDLTLGADGGFTFATELEAGMTYAVTVSVQPETQLCVVTGGDNGDGTGTMDAAADNSIVVTCTDVAKYGVGGTVADLVGEVTLQNNGADNLTLDANGPFTFPVKIADGQDYLVTVFKQPVTQDCAVANGSGTISGADVDNVAVTCVDVPTYAIGGTVSGLTGTVTLRNNGGDPLSVSSDGAFTFDTPLKEGDTYRVTVASNPVGQICTVSNGTGTVGTDPVTDITVECVAGVVDDYEAVPTLSTWGLLLLVLSVGLVAFANRRFF